MPTPAPVRLTELTKHFATVHAVDGIDLTVRRGEIYALLGLNGAGKTTTIRMLLAMIAPTTGTAELFGTPVHTADPDIWSKVGYLVETPSAYPELTVTQNLHLNARLHHLDDRHAVPAIIDRLALTPYAQRRARDLSLGNLQRLGLAKALLHQPELLILDEPANGLDPAGVVEIRHLLRDLADQGTTVLLSSHILSEVTRLATRIGIIDHGHMVTELAAEDLPAHVHRRLLIEARDLPGAAHALHAAGYQPRHVGDVITLTDARALQWPDEIATSLVHAGYPPTRLAIEQEDLETFFLRLVNEGNP